MVVAFHAGLPVPGGFVGVDVFFVISGFVITAMLHREWHQTGRIRFGRFYLRRFKRLTPALALMVAVTMLISVLVLSPLGTQQTAAKTAIGAMLLAANFVIARTTGGYFDAPAETNPLLNTWSLSVEEQFYLAFPALLALGWMLARRRGLLRFSPIVIVAGVAAVSFALAVAGSQGITFRGSGTVLGFYSPFTRAWEFAVGALLALVLAKRVVYAPRLLTAGGLVGAAMLAASLWLINDTTPFPGPWTLMPVTGTLLLLLAGSVQKAFSTRTLSTRPIVKIGDWSYSIYLWHWPLIVFAGLLWPNEPTVLLIAGLTSLIPAVASYHWVEQPIRALGQQPVRKTALLISVTVGVPLLAALGLGLMASQVWPPRIAPVNVEAAQEHAGYPLGCHFGPADGYQDPAPCVWNASDAGPPVYLLGDSNAAQYVEALITSTSELQRPLVVSTSSGCPLLDLSIRNPGNLGYEKACPARTGRLLDWMRDQEPGTVVLSHTDQYWLSSDYPVLKEDELETNDQASKARLMQEALIRTITHLQSSGHEVVVVQSVPHFFGPYTWDPASCTLFAALTGCAHEMPLDAALKRSQAVTDAVLKAGEVTGARVLDLAERICPNGKCVTRNDDMPIYSDAEHITVGMSEALSPVFADLLKDL
jgi:peptidoglycan/LPS O-acetylase OafA/YrhL